MKSRDKVLIVDDSDINRSLLADMLAQDYELVEASNGLEAVTVLSQQYNEISLVLLDIVMPMMDGFEVLASMNKSGYIDHIPVIMISAETSSAILIMLMIWGRRSISAGRLMRKRSSGGSRIRLCCMPSRSIWKTWLRSSCWKKKKITSSWLRS
ncbi:MAG: response regulator [Holdemania filiformis]